MKKQKNKHGLRRTIDPDIKKQIRLNSGFGCVICGLGIYEYEHVDPEFKDAKIHDASKMTLLCGQHHAKVTRGMMSKEIVKKAMKNPAALQNGFATETFEILNTNPLSLTIGNNTYINVETLLMIKNEPIVQIKSSEANKAPFLLSAKFYDSKNQISLQIIDNEWKVFSSNWDVTTIGNKLTIREKKGKIHLEIIVDSHHSITISRIEMVYKGYLVKGNDKKLIVKRPGEKEGLIAGGNNFANIPVAINVDS